LVLVVEALDRPLNPARLQRFCAVAQRSGAQVLTLLNKADSHPPSEEAWQALQHALPGMRLLAISARDGRGLQPVLDLLKPGVVAALLGPSGAGKSTLANRLAGADLQGVGLVRFGDGKGRHTTTSRRMIELPGGAWLIDSPGVREMGLVASGEGLDESFEDLRALAQGCRFRDCRHEQEPGCALRAAVEAGGLEAVRLGRFLALRLEGEIANRGRAGRQGRAKAPGSFKTLS
jgi:ribosome biogenesis GTPase